MLEDVRELLDTAIYKEIASQAIYEAGQSSTQNPGAKALMKELAGEELKHSKWLKDLKEKGLTKQSWHQEKVAYLKISEYLVGGNTLKDASLQGTLAFAIKHEQQAVEFYAKMMSIVIGESAKQLCEKLVNEEMKHKLRLELLYDDMFSGDN